MRQSGNAWFKYIFLLVILVVIGAGAYFYWKSSNNFLSPIPPKTSFQVIYYTPTPAEITPSSTPSATPKLKATPIPTRVPTKTTATPSAKLTITVGPTP